MGLVKKILEKYYPHLQHYEFFIKLWIDLIFLLVLVLLMIRANPQIIEYCPPINASFSNYSFILNQTVVTP
jgi:hypothetical protein